MTILSVLKSDGVKEGTTKQEVSSTKGVTL